MVLEHDIGAGRLKSVWLDRGPFDFRRVGVPHGDLGLEDNDGARHDGRRRVTYWNEDAKGPQVLGIQEAPGPRIGIKISRR